MIGANKKRLLIDAGNTCIKWMLANDLALPEQQRCFYASQTPIQQFERLLTSLQSGEVKGYAKSHTKDYAEIVMVSVLGESFNQQAKEIALTFGKPLLQIKSSKQLLGVSNAYEEAHKLGADRFVAMIGAYHLSNNQQKTKKACIIVDAGTATTIDAVNAKGDHLGGLILPGNELCKLSLLKNTQQLSKWGTSKNQEKPDCKLFSTNTADAIHSASILGLSGAIEQISLNMERELKTRNEDISVDRYLCGGSARIISSYLKSDFLLQEDLVMQGLNIISEHKNDY